jgi:tetratricopeptide (TPR) repeat protein
MSGHSVRQVSSDPSNPEIRKATQTARDLHNRKRRLAMRSRPSSSRTSIAMLLVSLLALGGCVSGSGGRRPINVPGAGPPAASEIAGNSVQELYESGRYHEVLSSVGTFDTSAQALWFAAQSSARLGQREDATRQFAQLPQVGGNPAWQIVSDLALALLRDDVGEIDRARAAAAAFPDDPFVLYELGLAHARRDDLPAAVQSFDRCTQIDPRFAYAYYSGGLSWNRLNRVDLAIARLEIFERLAPAAPERPEVASILRTVRGR